jgi:hypothetical protein
MSSMTSELTLKYVPLSKLTYWEQNPKLHDIGAISASITKHGFRDPLGWDCQLNGGEGGIVEGNGRLETLSKMRQQKQPAPRGILEADGDWLVPVLFGVDAESEVAAQAFGIDHNSLTMLGGDFTALDISKLYDDSYLELLENIMVEDAELLASISGDDWDFLKGLEDKDEGPISGLDDPGVSYRQKYAVAVYCDDEADQEKAFNNLKAQGYNCKILVL